MSNSPQDVSGIVAALRYSWALERLWPTDAVVADSIADWTAAGGLRDDLKVRTPLSMSLEPEWTCDSSKDIDAEFRAACQGMARFVAEDSWQTLSPSPLARQVHTALFGANWVDGAGRWRTVDLNFGAHWPNVAEAMHNLDLDHAVWISTEPVLVAIARYHARYEQVHPFVDGNGRSGRTVADLLLWRAGLQNARWGAGCSSGRVAYMAALVRAISGDESDLLLVME